MTKKIKKQKKVIVDSCFSDPPPWSQAKNKKEAYYKGEAEATRVLNYKISDLESKKPNSEYIRLRTDALRNICQAGSNVVEAMMKAYLAFEGQL